MPPQTTKGPHMKAFLLSTLAFITLVPTAEARNRKFDLGGKFDGVYAQEIYQSLKVDPVVSGGVATKEINGVSCTKVENRIGFAMGDNIRFFCSFKKNLKQSDLKALWNAWTIDPIESLVHKDMKRAGPVILTWDEDADTLKYRIYFAPECADDHYNITRCMNFWAKKIVPIYNEDNEYFVSDSLEVRTRLVKLIRDQFGNRTDAYAVAKIRLADMLAGPDAATFTVSILIQWGDEIHFVYHVLQSSNGLNPIEILWENTADSDPSFYDDVKGFAEKYSIGNEIVRKRILEIFTE